MEELLIIAAVIGFLVGISLAVILLLRGGNMSQGEKESVKTWTIICLAIAVVGFFWVIAAD